MPKQGDGAPTPEKPGNKAETVAESARQMALLIDRLPDEIVASFKSNDARQRKAALETRATEIALGMARVIGWVERRRTIEAANLVRARADVVLSTAIACAEQEIPEFAGGSKPKAPIEGGPSAGALQTASLFVTASLVANSLREWANDMEAEDARRQQWVASGPAGQSLHMPAVDDEDVRILRALFKYAPRLLTQDQIEAESRVSRKTVSPRIRGLVQAGWAAQPKGKKSGTTITQVGRNLLAQIDGTKTTQ
jgi:hypothetical protein